MSDQQTDNSTQNIAQAIQEVSERASLLVREEIELAKAEVTEKVTKLVKGAVVGIAAGIFAVFGLVFLLHGFAWLAWYELVPRRPVLLGLLRRRRRCCSCSARSPASSRRARSSPERRPTPEMAIDEAKRIRETVKSSHPEQTI